MTQQYDFKDHDDDDDPRYIAHPRWAVTVRDRDSEIVLALFLVENDALRFANTFQKLRVFKTTAPPVLFDEAQDRDY